MTIQIAMWSGPRCLSTAMMRAWENRPDTTVIDEPFYAHYLSVTGKQHPMRDEVLASQPTDWSEVAATLRRPAPGEEAIRFQKHMAQHLLPHMDTAWLDGMRIAFLVRDPRAILASYHRRRAEVTAEDIGVLQLGALFAAVAERHGTPPPVVLAPDLQRDPRGVLTALCARLDVPFSEHMLSWPPGPRATDGVWAPAWYDNVERSTGFSPPTDREVTLPAPLERIAEKVMPAFDALCAARIT